jgi:Flp pilus assembly protein CpaB
MTMPRFSALAAYVLTFGSMTAAALVVITLIILGGGDDDRSRGSTVPVVVANQDIPAGTRIDAHMLGLVDVRPELVPTGVYSQVDLVIAKQ